MSGFLGTRSHRYPPNLERIINKCVGCRYSRRKPVCTVGHTTIIRSNCKYDVSTLQTLHFDRLLPIGQLSEYIKANYVSSSVNRMFPEDPSYCITQFPFVYTVTYDAPFSEFQRSSIFHKCYQIVPHFLSPPP